MNMILRSRFQAVFGSYTGKSTGFIGNMGRDLNRILPVLLVLIIFLSITGNIRADVPKYKGATLNEIALFLGGKKLPADSVLQKKTRSASYKRFKRSMQSYWRKYKRSTVNPMRTWRKKWLSDVDNKTCFYPFAGADFINAYNMYPQAERYVMFGMEKGGGAPDIRGMSARRLAAGLNMMVRGYNIFINFNFYRTLGMGKYMNKSSIVGTVPHMLAQMAWLGLKPIRLYSVSVNKKGELKLKELNDTRYSRRTAIEFEDKDGNRKKVIYVQIDIRNSSLRRLHGWRKFFAGLDNASGILKAATYLPPRPYYSIINKICLDNMDVIVQDDSGIAYRYLKGKYKITLFGRYKQPHAIFPSYGQADLRAAYRRAKYRPLPFKFAYDRPNGWRNCLIARKK